MADARDEDVRDRSSTSEFHASHVGQRPSQRGDSPPHSPHRKTVLTRAIRTNVRPGCDSVAHPPPEMWIDSEDTAAMQALQARIEAGERFWIAGVPETTAPHHQRVPVASHA